MSTEEQINFLEWTTAENIKLPAVEEKILPIQIYPIHKQKLRFKALPVASEEDARDPKFREFVAHMVTTMYNPEHPGVGLAANQVAFPYQVCVVDHQWTQTNSPLPKVLLNPQILQGEGENSIVEGCLSVPCGFRQPVRRYAKIRVKALTLDWEPIEFDAEGFEAIVIQHEIDHLNGKVFLDHLSRLKQDMFNRKVRKIARIEYKKMKKQKRALNRIIKFQNKLKAIRGEEEE